MVSKTNTLTMYIVEQTAPLLADGVAPTRAPSSSPLTEPAPASPDIVPQEIKLPDMIPADSEPLCQPPAMDDEAWYDGSLEDLRHQMMERRDNEPEPRKVGIDVPWAPDELTGDTVKKAHGEATAKWLENGIKNPNPAPDREEHDSSDEEESLRSIPFDCVAQPWPIGPAAGEEFIILPPRSRSKKAQTLYREQLASKVDRRPDRPVGCFDPAEMLHWRHEQRRMFVERLLAQEGTSWEGAVEMAIGEGGVEEWERLRDEAETAEMVLMVYGKLAPMKEWMKEIKEREAMVREMRKGKTAPPKRQARKTASPRGKGKAAANSLGLGSAAADPAPQETITEVSEAGAQDPTMMPADEPAPLQKGLTGAAASTPQKVDTEVGEAGEQDFIMTPPDATGWTGQASSADAASASLVYDAQTSGSGQQDPSATAAGVVAGARDKRKRKPSAKAMENGASGEESEEPSTPSPKRQRRS